MVQDKISRQISPIPHQTKTRLKSMFLTFWVPCTLRKSKVSSLKWHKLYCLIMFLSKVVSDISHFSVYLLDFWDFLNIFNNLSSRSKIKHYQNHIRQLNHIRKLIKFSEDVGTDISLIVPSYIKFRAWLLWLLWLLWYLRMIPSRQIDKLSMYFFWINSFS